MLEFNPLTNMCVLSPSCDLMASLLATGTTW